MLQETRKKKEKPVQIPLDRTVHNTTQTVVHTTSPSQQMFLLHFFEEIWRANELLFERVNPQNSFSTGQDLTVKSAKTNFTRNHFWKCSRIVGTDKTQVEGYFFTHVQVQKFSSIKWIKEFKEKKLFHSVWRTLHYVHESSFTAHCIIHEKHIFKINCAPYNRVYIASVTQTSTTTFMAVSKKAI